MPDDFYYLNAERQPVGPMQLDGIRKLVAAEIVGQDVLVCPAGEEEWKPLPEWSEPASDSVGPPRVPPPPRSPSPISAARSTDSSQAFPGWMAPASMAAGILSILTTFVPALALLIAVPALVGGILILKRRTSSGRGFALTAVLTGALGALPALLFVLGMFFGTLTPGNGEADAIEKVLEHDQALNREAKSKFPKSAPQATRYIAENIQRIDTTRCPPEFRLAFQQHVNAWTQAVPYIQADTPLTAFFEGLYAGATEDYRALGLSNYQARVAKEQINATHREVLNIAAAYGARIPTP